MKKLVLTEDEREAYNRLVELAKIADTGKKSEKPKSSVMSSSVLACEIIKPSAIRYLVAFISGQNPKRALETAKLGWLDVQLCRYGDAEFKSAIEFAERERKRIITMKAQTALEGLIDGEKGADVRAVTFALERLGREDYGREERTQAQAVTGGGITYNINISRLPCDNPVTIGEVVDIVDDKAVIDA